MRKILGITAGLFVFCGSIFAQQSEGGTPISFKQQVLNSDYYILQNNVELSAPDLTEINAQDLVNDSKMAYRVGINLPVQLNLSNAGNWTPVANGRLWQLTITCKGAQALGINYDKVSIPKGAKLFLYNQRKTQVIGAFTSNTAEFYSTEMIEGSQIHLEYFVPNDANETGEIEIAELVYFYRGVEDHIRAYRDDQPQIKAGSCEVNVACSEADNWKDQVHSVIQYSFTEDDGYTYLCSASLINNTALDCTPYILTATHCGKKTTSASLNNNVWYFNYENPNCAAHTSYQYPQTPATATGGVFCASSKNTWTPADTVNQVYGSDFTLVKLKPSATLPSNAYFEGWDRSGVASPSGVGIHHPAGNDKKISTYTTTLTTTTFNGGLADSHWQVVWAATTNGHGVTEGGSSGSPIFNNNKQVVGMLSGGTSYCSTPTDPDDYGKLAVSWNPSSSNVDGRLKEWLDPINSGVMILDGAYSPCTAGFNEYEKPNDVTMYPNPTNDLITVDFGADIPSDGVVNVIDLTGKVILSESISQQKTIAFNLSSFAKGIYQVQISSSAFAVTKKIIKL